MYLLSRGCEPNHVTNGASQGWDGGATERKPVWHSTAAQAAEALNSGMSPVIFLAAPSLCSWKNLDKIGVWMHSRSQVFRGAEIGRAHV